MDSYKNWHTRMPDWKDKKKGTKKKQPGGTSGERHTLDRREESLIKRYRPNANLHEKGEKKRKRHN